MNHNRRLDLSKYAGLKGWQNSSEDSIPGTRLSVVKVGDATFYLERDGEDLVLRGDDGNAVAVDSVEATLLFNEAEPTPLIHRVGISLDLQIKTKFDLQVDDVRSQLPSDGHVVMMDATTVRDALSTLQTGGTPDPLELLDLSTLVTAIICYDNIVVQPFPGAECLPGMGGGFVVLNYPDDFIPATLWTLCASLDGGSSGAGSVDRSSFADAWAKFLNIEPGRLNLDFGAFDAYQDSPFQWDGLPASTYFSRLTSLADQSTRLDLDEVSLFLSIQTIRTLFNDRLASLLGLPYLSSSLRAPIQSILLSRKIRTSHLVDRLLSQVGPPSVDHPHRPTESYVGEFSAPFLLGLVFAKMRSVDDFWPVVLEYRKKFEPLRRQLWKDRQQWLGGSGRYLSTYLRHLSSRGKALVDAGSAVVDGIATVAGSAATATIGDLGSVGAGLKLIKLLNPADRLKELYLRAFKPHVYLLFNISTEAKNLKTATHDIQRIWGGQWDRRQFDQLAKLVVAQPEDFLRLRDVGSVAG